MGTLWGLSPYNKDTPLPRLLVAWIIENNMRKERIEYVINIIIDNLAKKTLSDMLSDGLENISADEVRETWGIMIKIALDSIDY